MNLKLTKIHFSFKVPIYLVRKLIIISLFKTELCNSVDCYRDYVIRFRLRVVIVIVLVIVIDKNKKKVFANRFQLQFNYNFV